MGDERAVVTNQPIFTRNRIKLVNQGARVDSALFDRLVSHKLIPRIDECLDVENGITRQVLRDGARKLLDDDPALAVLRADPGLLGRTVFEHHERLDGSGYPRGLKGGEISRDAQILMLAEVANTVFESSPQSQNLAKLSVLLRLNHKKFNRDLGNRLIALVAAMQSGHREDDDHSTAFANLSRLPPRLDELAHVFSDWSETFRTFSQSTKNAPTSLISLVIDERRAERLGRHAAAGPHSRLA